MNNLSSDTTTDCKLELFFNPNLDSVKLTKIASSVREVHQYNYDLIGHRMDDRSLFLKLRRHEHIYCCTQLLNISDFRERLII